jgi:DnaJ family protein C protein 17
LDASVRAKDARKARFAKFDAKRKNLQEELEERERAFKKQKLDKAKEAKAREQENERIKEEGRKLREEKEKELKKREEEVLAAKQEEDEVPQLGECARSIGLT